LLIFAWNLIPMPYAVIMDYTNDLKIDLKGYDRLYLFYYSIESIQILVSLRYEYILYKKKILWRTTNRAIALPVNGKKHYSWRYFFYYWNPFHDDTTADEKYQFTCSVVFFCDGAIVERINFCDGIVRNVKNMLFPLYVFIIAPIHFKLHVLVWTLITEKLSE
jgi:hypothetical protein